jgi:ribosome-associated protein
MENISITTEFIRLDAFLKLAALASSGGEAKHLISEGLVSLNGEPCLQRGRKLYPGDVVTFSSKEYRVNKA